MANRKTPDDVYGSPGGSLTPAERELIVVVDPAARVRATREGVAAARDVAPLAGALAAAGATMRPLFGASEERLRLGAREAPGAAELPDLSVYYRVDAPEEALDELAETLREEDVVLAAYVKPPAFPAVATVKARPVSSARGRAARPTAPPVPKPAAGGAPRPERLNDMTPGAEEAPPASPDFSARQGYLDPAPGGIDARYAWTRPGGSGTGVRIIDIEGEWRFTHEDLVAGQGGVVGGVPPNDLGWRNHGTAVVGEFSGDRNAFGVTGICPDANVRAVSIFGFGTAPAIRRAADLLAPGDVILIELHRPGPRATGVGQRGFIAIEWWPDDFDAIRYATARGVIVVEAAGNGAENLDDAVYDTPAAGFPAGWSNPFRRGARDSGAILVGAGAPPPGTHGRDWGPDRSRLDFSNFGAAVDAQGWGREVTTAGYGDLQGGSSEDLWYTDQFSGTSSASPIVVGAVGCVQGHRRATQAALLTPAAARALLRGTGSVQTDAPGRPASQRIGNRPNLRQAISAAPLLAVPLYRYWNPQATDHFYTTHWSELGSGAHGWHYERVECYAFPQQVPPSVPLHRYWNAAIGDHFYTTHWGELGAGAHGWVYEGVQCYVYPQPAAGAVPLYRYWNGAIGDHFYTTRWTELGSGAHGWAYEGIQCYVPTQANPPAADEEAPAGESAMPGGGAPGGGAGAGEGMAPATFRAAGALADRGPGESSFRLAPSSASSFETGRRRSRGLSFTVHVHGDDE